MMKMETLDLLDAYIVLDISPRFMSVVYVTFDKEKAEKMAAISRDYVIVQASHRDYSDTWRF
jgi:hypothetical protein